MALLSGSLTATGGAPDFLVQQLMPDVDFMGSVGIKGGLQDQVKALRLGGPVRAAAERQLCGCQSEV